MIMMRTGWIIALAALAVFCCDNVFAGVVYVSASDGNDSNDGSNWTLAKQTIQGGVDAALAGDTVLVTNGTYNTGGRIPPGQVLCQTRVVIDKAVSVISINGSSNTFIVGQGPRGDNAIRCVWMTNNTLLTGFTLTNGFTVAGVGGADENGGGVCSVGTNSMISNCVITTCQAYNGGGAQYSTLDSCTLTGNTSSYGGGAYNSILYRCMLGTNYGAYGGGGVYNCTLYDCTVVSNRTIRSGGGAHSSKLVNSTISRNAADDWGGGVCGCTLTNCIITSNKSLTYYGGGATDGTLNNCILIGNRALLDGGGAVNSTLNNCVLYGNSANRDGGGASQSTLNNCTVYANTNGGLISGTARNTISYGNTRYEMTNVSAAVCYTNDPLFVNAAAGNLRLESNSLCINTGNNIFAPTNVTPYDLDGNPRIAQLTVDKGAYEFHGVEFFDLFATADLHGTIIPSGMIRTNQGADVSFAIQPDAYYHVENILTNGVSAGTATNFTWYSISAPGTVTVSFVATLAARGTPHWWLAQWGWTDDFDVVESLDQDGDGLFTWEEYPPNTCPTNANTDGDQYDDGVEVNAGADALQDDSQAYGAMQAHPASFNLYTSNSVLDLSYGEMMVQMVSNNIQVRLTMQSTDMLDGDGWTNVGTAVEWECPADLNKSFFRFLGAPVD